MYSVDVDVDDTLSVRIDTTGVGEFEVSVYNYNRVPWIITFVIYCTPSGKTQFAACFCMAAGSCGNSELHPIC